MLEFFEGRAIVIPDFDEEDPGAEYPAYVKNKEDTIRSWRGMTVDPEDTEGVEVVRAHGEIFTPIEK